MFCVCVHTYTHNTTPTIFLEKENVQRNFITCFQSLIYIMYIKFNDQFPFSLKKYKFSRLYRVNQCKCIVIHISVSERNVYVADLTSSGLNKYEFTCIMYQDVHTYESLLRSFQQLNVRGQTSTQFPWTSSHGYAMLLQFPPSHLLLSKKGTRV